MSDLNLIIYCDYLKKNSFLSKQFLKELFNNREKEINDIMNKDRNEININNFVGLKINSVDNYKIPFYSLGKINNSFWIRSIDDKELYIYDEFIGAKVRVNYNFSKNTTSLFQMNDGNLIIVYSNNLKIGIIEMKNIYNKIDQIYFLSDKNDYILNEVEEENYPYILKVIETHNKNIVVLSKQSISFYYNKSLLNSKENENLPKYDYKKYSNIFQSNNIMNISLLEFKYNFIFCYKKGASCFKGKIKINIIMRRYFHNMKNFFIFKRI